MNTNDGGVAVLPAVQLVIECLEDTDRWIRELELEHFLTRGNGATAPTLPTTMSVYGSIELLHKAVTAGAEIAERLHYIAADRSHPPTELTADEREEARALVRSSEGRRSFMALESLLLSAAGVPAYWAGVAFSEAEAQLSYLADREVTFDLDGEVIARSTASLSRDFGEIARQLEPAQHTADLPPRATNRLKAMANRTRKVFRALLAQGKGLLLHLTNARAAQLAVVAAALVSPPVAVLASVVALFAEWKIGPWLSQLVAQRVALHGASKKAN